MEGDRIGGLRAKIHHLFSTGFPEREIARLAGVVVSTCQWLIGTARRRPADLRELPMRDHDDIAQRINTRPRYFLHWAKSVEFRPQMFEASVPQGNCSPKGFSEMN